MIPPELAERHLLSSIRTVQDFREAKESNITPDCFGVYRGVWEFLDDFIRDFKHFPSEQVLDERFPSLSLDSPLPLQPCIDSVLENYCKRSLLRFFANVAERLDTDDPRHLLKEILSSLKDIDKTQVRRSFAIFDHDALDRLQRYYSRLAQRQRAGLLGIPTGLPTFDSHLFGWQPGRLTAIIARLGLGKSWTLSYFAIQAHHAGKRVLFISPEMTKLEVEDRFDTLYAYILKGYNIKNSALSSGSAIDVDQFSDYLGALPDESRMVIYDNNMNRPFDIESIDYLVDDVAPDILFIDGAALLNSSSGRKSSAADWQDFFQISYGLKNLAMSRNVPVIVTSQANREAGLEYSKHPTIEQISYGDSLAQAADIVISIAKPKREQDERILRTLKLLKARGAAPLYDLIFLRYDVDNGVMMETNEHA